MISGTYPAEDGARLAYRDTGVGPPVLALAGLTRDGRDFDYMARRLPEVRLIRLDCRGRGDSDWTGAETYTPLQEARDALALLDHLGIPRAAIIGSSRGGLLGLVMAATAPARMAGLCLNDVGPVLERAGLERIGSYIGIRPSVPTLAEAADRMPAAMPGFRNLPPLRWEEETVRRYVETRDGLELPYDPALRDSFESAMSKPIEAAWPLFDACAGMPLAVIRGANSDVLSRETCAAMLARRPDLIHVEIDDRGHAPFLDEPPALDAIRLWLDRCFPDDAAAGPGGAGLSGAEARNGPPSAGAAAEG